MRSEDEIKEVNDAIDAICTGHNDCPCTPIRTAITELLTLRRRLEDRDALAVHILNYEHLPASGLARVIISYLTEGKDGE